MPVIHVRMLPQQAGLDIPRIMKGMCCAVAKVLEIPEHSVWATWELLPPGTYVEGGTEAHIQPQSTHPPIVSITMLEGRKSESIEAVLLCIADELARGLRIESGNVFISYLEASKGRVYTGGKIRG